MARKTAISARVIGRSGQYCGGETLHPPVIPEAARASMNWKYGLPVGTSVKVAVAGAGLTWRR